ncbi:hypothetical protein AB5N19_11134 [Seiridium cardinale]
MKVVRDDGTNTDTAWRQTKGLYSERGWVTCPVNFRCNILIFQHYASITCPSAAESAIVRVENEALKSHEDVLKGFKILCERPRSTRNEFVAATFRRDSSAREKNYAATTVVKASLMIDVTYREFLSQSPLDKVSGAKWEDDQSFLDFFQQSFPCDQFRTADKERYMTECLNAQKSFRARKLLKRRGIKIKGTDDLLEHLQYNPRDKSLKVFHHIAFLQSHLRISKGESLELDFQSSLRSRTLPPRPMLETLVSFHSILFPIATIGDKRSRSLLKDLVQHGGFDADGMWLDYVREIPPISHSCIGAIES